MMMRAVKPILCTNRYRDEPGSTRLTWNYLTFPRCYLDIQVDGKTFGRLIIELRLDVAAETCNMFRKMCLANDGEGYAGTNVQCILPKILMEVGVQKCVLALNSSHNKTLSNGSVVASQEMKPLQNFSKGEPKSISGVFPVVCRSPSHRSEVFSSGSFASQEIKPLHVFSKGERKSICGALPDVSRAPSSSQRRLSVGCRAEDALRGIKHVGEGVVSMAAHGRCVSKKFSITFRSAPWMDTHNVAFGRVVLGLDVLFKLEQLGTKFGQPSRRVVIKKCGQI